MSYEVVNSWHPDKQADRIAGALVDFAYKKNKNPKIAVEVLLGHGHCHIIAETSVRLFKKDVSKIVKRIVKEKVKLDLQVVPQDPELAKNQAKEIRAGDNGLCLGRPVTKEQVKLVELCNNLENKYKSDGKYIFDIKDNKYIVCQSRAKTESLKNYLSDIGTVIVNPLGDWTGSINVDSGCIEENELVLTKDGFKRIKDTEIGDLVQTKNGLNRVVNKINKGQKDTLAVVDKRNHEVIVTPDHKLLVFRDNKFSFVEAKDLTSDYLLVKNNQDVDFNSHHIKKVFYTERNQKNKHILDTNFPDWAYLLGYLIGDGWYNTENNLVQFSCCGEDEFNRIYTLLSNKLCIEPKVYVERQFNKLLKKEILDRKITICSKSLCELLNSLGFKKGAINKEIPNCILKAKKSIQAAFISGLFDSDGSCGISKSGRNCGLETIAMTYTSISKRLIKDLSILLNNFNIQTTITKPKITYSYLTKTPKQSWQITIPGERSKRKFLQIIGFKLPRKMKCLSQDQLDKRTRDFEFDEMRSYPCYTIAPLINKDTYLRYRYGLEKYSDLSSKKMNRFISYQKFTFVLDLYGKYKDSDEYKFAENLLKYNLIQFKTSYKTGLKTVYDLQIENEHSFTANEFIVHNCTNRKLGSDLGDSVTGGGIHGKDISKADVSANIYCFLLAQKYNKAFSGYYAIGDVEIKINNKSVSYKYITEVAKKYIDAIGGFEKLAAQGLIRSYCNNRDIFAVKDILESLEE